jgi:hypothetical protein
MKVNNTCCPVSVQNGNINNDKNNRKGQNVPNFGSAALAAPLVGLATFIETNGFLGEFLTVDTTGMAAPRAIQGYNRNKKELGHLNYKAGTEETIREALSGPAFFFVPAIVLGVAAMIKGKSAKVTTDAIDAFKGIMGKASKNITDVKNSKEVKEKFIDSLTSHAFKDFNNETGEIGKIKDILSKVVDAKNEKGKGYFEKRKVVKNAKKEAEAALSTLNKANGKNINNTTVLKIGEKDMEITNLIDDIPNYLHDFNQKAQKSSVAKENFIDTFHKQAEKTRRTTNILAVSALSAFLLIIPTLYQKDKKFPGLDGLNAGDASQKRLTSIAHPKKGGQNENK